MKYKRAVNKQKQSYIPPQISTYDTQTLLRQLGPARAISHGRSAEDELLALGRSITDP